MIKKIAILGEFNPNYSTHHALNDSVRQVQKRFEREIQFDWISSEIFNFSKDFENHYCGLWIAPGSPYKDMDNVLETIKFTRENDIPTFGNCGGFQHMVIEFAKNVCGIADADHEETNPNAENLVISKLSCSLVEQQEELEIIETNSLLFEIVGKEKIIGKYFCSYGVNEKYVGILKQNGLKFTARSVDGQMRAFELDNHRFFLGTLFQPALTSTIEEPNPLIVEFVKRSVGNEFGKTFAA